MKTVFRVLFIYALALGLLVTKVQASSNQDYLIEKLNRLNLNLAPNDPSRSAITLRLADLLSERARSNAQLISQGECKQCPSPDTDRKKALDNYTQVFSTLSVDKKSAVLVQMGHLYQLLGQTPKALDSYSKLTQPEYTSQARSEAYLSMAEIYFKKSDWSLAKNNYIKSIEANETNPGSKGFATYKLGWCLYNLGQFSDSKEKLLSVLKTPAYLSKSGSSEAIVDQSFKEQVARDYAQISGQDFKDSDLKNVYDLSPENKRLDNVGVLASELERTGKKAEALMAWNYLYQYQSKPEERALTKAHVGFVNVQMQKNTDAGAAFAEVYSLVSAVKEEKNIDFEDARRLVRSSIVTWNQAEKKKPSQELLDTYVGYLNNFKFEKEMSTWATSIATDLKKWDVAWKLQQQALTQVSLADQGGKAYEQQLLQGIELAELSKDSQLMSQAQDQYLNQSKLKTKYWEVLYQKNYIAYEKAENENFLQAFDQIINSDQAPADIRLKTADLYMDYLALKKRDAEIATKGAEFHNKLAKLKGYDGSFSKLSQKAILNQVVVDAKDNKYEDAWKRLQNFQIKGADEKDVVTYYKNKMIIAEKRKDIDSALTASQSMKSLKNLTEDDQSFVNAKLAYYSDLKLDFKSAMNATTQIPATVLAEDKKNLKLALYSDLLGQNSQPYLEKFIAASADKNTKTAAIYELVKSSKNSEELLKKYEKELSTNKDYISDLMASSYNKSKSKSFGFEIYKKSKDLKETAGYQAIYRDQLLTTLNDQNTQLKKMVLPTDATVKTFQKNLATDMKTRIAALNKLDESANQAIQSKDWTTQTVALTIVGLESERFYNEIMSLPMPEGLTPAEQGEYMNLLGQQASPYKIKADQALAKAKDFWLNTEALNALQNRMNGSYEQLAINEQQVLLSVAQDANKVKVQSMASNKKVDETATNTVSTTTNKEFTAAWNDVKNSPFDLTSLEKLKNLGAIKGQAPLVQYLESRINEIKNPTKEVQ